jgi:sarcosine oxidase subunit alpha
MTAGSLPPAKPDLSRHIALGVLRGGRARFGETVTVCDEEDRLTARVVSPVFYDPENTRLKFAPQDRSDERNA